MSKITDTGGAEVVNSEEEAAEAAARGEFATPVMFEAEPDESEEEKSSQHIIQVESVHEAPDDKVVHCEDEIGLFYVEKLAPSDEPGENHVFGPDEEHNLEPDDCYCEEEDEVFDQFDECDYDDVDRRLCPYCGTQLQEYDKVFQLSEKEQVAEKHQLRKADWVPYQGPRGGEGWQNVESGEVVYDDEPPGDIDIDPDAYHNADSDSLLDAIETVTEEDLGEDWQEMDADEIREAIQEMADPDQFAEVMEELDGGDGFDLGGVPEASELEEGQLVFDQGNLREIHSVSEDEVKTRPFTGYDFIEGVPVSTTYTEHNLDEGDVALSREYGKLKCVGRSQEFGTTHEFVTEEGEKITLNLSFKGDDKVYRPASLRLPSSDLEGSWEKYEDIGGEYTEDDIPDGVDTDFGNIDGDAKDSVINELGRLNDLGVLKNVDSVVTEKPEGYDDEYEPDGNFNPSENRIWVNSESISHEAWDQSTELGLNVVGSYEDLIRHEATHAAHYDAMEYMNEVDSEKAERMQHRFNRGLSNSEEEHIKEMVSEYASTSPLELVAEVGTKILSGEEVHPAMLELYEKYGGPEL